MKNGIVGLALLMFWLPHLSASPNPGAIRIVNLGDRAITAFTLVGFEFRDVGTDRGTGVALTPAFGSDATKYELYWRLDDGSVHGETVDLADHLPQDADNDPVVIGIHDDRLSVTWSKEHPQWIQHRRVGDPRIHPPPSVPRLIGCQGELLDHPLAKAAWKEQARWRLAAEPGTDVDMYRCELDWYIPRSDRLWDEPDEQTGRQLRAQWQAEIEAYRKTKQRE